MLFYKIVNKKTQNKNEINKIFFSELKAQIYADTLNQIYKSERYYVLDPFIYIFSEEEKEMYSGLVKKRKLNKNSYRNTHIIH